MQIGLQRNRAIGGKMRLLYSPLGKLYLSVPVRGVIFCTRLLFTDDLDSHTKEDQLNVTAANLSMLHKR